VTGRFPRLVLVVSTLGGRLPQLERLLQCVQDDAPDATVLVADQSNGSAVRDLAARFPIARVVPSGRGLSVGRNACLDHLPEGEPAVVLFPNDNTSYPPGVLAGFRARMGELDVLAGRLAYPDGTAPFPVPAERTVLHRGNAPLAMSATMAVRSTWFQSGLRFDEGLGSGADSPFQAAEETDLLLRILAAGGSAELHPDLVIGGEDATAEMPLGRQIRKTWGYARAHTYVLRRHGWSRGQLAATLLRPLARAVLSLVRLDHRQAIVAVTRSLGRCRGLVSR
jgi:hypothetical protein